MFGDLHNVSEDELLNFVLMILNRPGRLSAFDRTELHQINDELKRRDSKLTLVIVEDNASHPGEQ